MHSDIVKSKNFYARKVNDITYFIYHTIGSNHIAEIYQEVDGYYVLDGNSIGPGYIPSYALIEIGEILDKLNKEWDDIIQNDPRIG